MTSQKNVCVGGYRVSDPEVPSTKKLDTLILGKALRGYILHRTSKRITQKLAYVSLHPPPPDKGKTEGRVQLHLGYAATLM